ncbi:MAG: tetratricopeptide repeat protein, partial [Oscillochloris sp.]|nr:tetratricopeptide repeat protein [Oscillochloris sp.]
QRAGDIAKAELLLNRALNQAPNAPSLLNNLGAVYGAQGRSAEAEALARRIVAEYPDYIFGRTNMVSYLIQEGKLDEAQALIEPLLRRTRMHVGEFGALAGAQCSILLAQGNPKAAEGWLNMWEQADADHPLIPAYRSKLRAAARAKRPKKR